MATPPPKRIIRLVLSLIVLFVLNFTLMDVFFILCIAPVQRASGLYVSAQILSALVMCLLIRLRIIVP